MEMASERGRMLATGLSWPQAVEAVAPFADRVAAGAYNGPNSVVLSGDGPTLEAIAATLEARGIFKRGYVERLLADPERSLTPKGHSKLWQIAVLESWLQTHGVRA